MSNILLIKKKTKNILVFIISLTHMKQNCREQYGSLVIFLYYRLHMNDKCFYYIVNLYIIFNFLS